jgi:magnesium chelatase subunit I
MKKRPVFPFPAIEGQDDMKLVLILTVINPDISGVLIRGEKGTAKSTAVRALADILPEIQIVKGCPFQQDPEGRHTVCLDCGETDCRNRVLNGPAPETAVHGVRVIELPVGATEDRVVGTMDLEQALKKGEKRIEPGLLAAAHRGFLYVDEVNLLDDHVVDVLLDSAAMGVNTIEREGISFSHPARFTLVGTMNPEEGELRPQLLDRFGLCVTVKGVTDREARVRIMQRRSAFDDDPEKFATEWKEAAATLSDAIENAIALYPNVTCAESLYYDIAGYCLDVGVDGHRGDIIMLKTAKTLAAYKGRTEVIPSDIDRAAGLVLPHRVRRQPLQDIVVDVAGMRK